MEKKSKKIVWIKHHVKEKTCDVCYSVTNEAGYPKHTVEHFRGKYYFDYTDIDKKVNKKEANKNLWINFISFIHSQIRKIDRGLTNYKQKLQF